LAEPQAWLAAATSADARIAARRIIAAIAGAAANGVFSVRELWQKAGGRVPARRGHKHSVARGAHDEQGEGEGLGGGHFVLAAAGLSILRSCVADTVCSLKHPWSSPKNFRFRRCRRSNLDQN
jgi:hypothetical protein